MSRHESPLKPGDILVKQYKSPVRQDQSPMKKYRRLAHCAVSLMLLGCLAAQLAAQTTYQPKFKGDPARSDSEAAALGYMRTVLRAQKTYKKKYDKFAQPWRNWSTPDRSPGGWCKPTAAITLWASSQIRTAST